ncbi:MAG: DNA-directed RNA polymerase subunit alpha [Candidatus Shapirobacteria bacterium]
MTSRKGDEVEVVIEPLEKGFGCTVGNALRRVLLTSIKGAAVTQVKIGGVKHRFSVLSGMKEDVIELILNLKQLRIKYKGEKPVKLVLDKCGPGRVTAKDIEKAAGVAIINPELVLANLARKEERLRLEMVVESGVGYSLAEERKSDEVGVIPLDSVFSPIRRVNYRVEATRVGRRTDLDRLIMEITTDGTIEPEAAVKEAADVLIKFFKQISDPKVVVEEEKTGQKSDDPALKLTVEELDLPIRIANALRKSGFATVADVVMAPKADLIKVKNLGEKSLEIVADMLKKRGLVFKEEA